MFAFERMFDVNHDGHLDLFERVVQFGMMEQMNRESCQRSGLTDFVDNDNVDVFADAGLDYDELEFMDPSERRGVLEDAGLDPDEFDF